MVLTGQVYDNQTGQGIPYASVQITDSTATSFMGGTAAAEDGTFELDNPLLNTGTSYLYVTSTGYVPVIVSDEVYINNGKIGLDEAGGLPVVYVMPKSHENDWIIYLLFGGGLYLLLAYGEKERKVSGVQIPKLSQNQWIDIALKLGIPIAIYFLIVEPILIALNILPDKNEKKQKQSDDRAAVDQSALAVYNSTDNHTYPQSTIDAVAVALRNDTSHAYGYNWGDFPYQLTWLPGMTYADARYFLGTFVEKNGYTFYQWYKDKFADAFILAPFNWETVVFDPAWYESGEPHDYSAFYAKVGITEDNAGSLEWWAVVKKFIDLIYSRANVTQQ